MKHLTKKYQILCKDRTFKVAVQFALALIVLTTAGCGGGGSGGPALTDSGSGAVTATGGTVTTKLRKVTITIPPGFVSGPANVLVETFSGDPFSAPTDFVAASDVVRVTVEGADVSPSSKARLAIATTAFDPMLSGTLAFYEGSYGSTAVQPDSSGTSETTIDVPGATLRQTGKSRMISSVGRYLIVNFLKSLKPVPPRVDLYKFDSIHDPANTEANFKNHKDWTSELSPTWSQKRIALVLHGINNSLSNMSEVASYLKRLRKPDGSKNYDDVYGVDYDFRAHIGDTGNALASVISSIPTDGAAVDVIAYSTGGLVSRWALEQRLAGTSSELAIRRLITLGTPHLGVPITGVASWISRFVVSPDARAVGSFNSPGVRDLLADSEFITQLNGSQGRSNAQYWALAGDNWADYMGLVGTAAREAMDVDCDGIVPVYSGLGNTLTSKARKWDTLKVFHLTHSQMRGEIISNNLNLDTSGANQLIGDILNTGNVGVEIR